MTEDSTIEGRAKTFLSSRKTLKLATVSNVGNWPTASHAPFIQDDNYLYVYVSALSKHTQEMKDNCQISAVVVEDEVSAMFRIFEMKRITFTCTAVAVNRAGSEWSRIIDLFDKSFGKSFEQVKPLRDFTLFRLIIHNAFYVEGFGKAFRMNRKLEDAVHVRGTGPDAEAHAGEPEDNK
jgi:putative heme iron utilization protein